MTEDATIIGGIVFPSTDPVFPAVVIGLHIPLDISTSLRAQARCGPRSVGDSPPMRSITSVQVARPHAVRSIGSRVTVCAVTNVDFANLLIRNGLALS
jgi:hypothetical protein